MKENNSKQVLLSVLGVAILVVAVVGVSFAAFSYSKTGEKVNTITTGTITMSYSETTNGINLTDALPMRDEQGKGLKAENQYFDFTVGATISGNTTINYAVTATKEADSTLPEDGVKLYLTNMDDSADTELMAPTKFNVIPKTVAGEESNAPEGQAKLYTGTFDVTDTHSFRLRMWVADDYAVSGSKQTFKVRVNVYGAADAQ